MKQMLGWPCCYRYWHLVWVVWLVWVAAAVLECYRYLAMMVVVRVWVAEHGAHWVAVVASASLLLIAVRRWAAGLQLFVGAAAPAAAAAAAAAA